MKYIDKKYLIIAGTLFIFALLSSCKKFVQLPPSSYQIQAAVVFADSTDATTALVGIYENMTDFGSPLVIGNGGITINTGLSGDELTYGGSDPSYLQLFEDAVNAQTNQYTGTYLYDNTYSNSGLIYPANALIEGVNSSKTLTASLKTQLIGEAEVLRAFAYFNLVNLYGAVPLVTTTNYR